MMHVVCTVLSGARGKFVCVCKKKKIHKNNGMKKGMNGNIIFKGALFPLISFLFLYMRLCLSKIYVERMKKIHKIFVLSVSVCVCV